MESILKKLTVGINAEAAFKKFSGELNAWWPAEYTWSNDKLKEIRIDAKKNGLCTEIGPHGFRCDWGRVTELIANRKIAFKWQIGPSREPVPDPAKASDVVVEFQEDGDSTVIVFQHFNFHNHGERGGEYRKMMDSELGWDYILDAYKKYCE